MFLFPEVRKYESTKVRKYESTKVLSYFGSTRTVHDSCLPDARGLDEGITAPATAGPHAHSNAACFARHRLAVVVRTVVVVSNRRGTRTTTFRKIIARHRAKRLERNGTNGQDRHATSFPIPLGPQEMPRDSRDEAGQRRPSPFSRRAVSNRRGNRTTTFSKDQRAASREEMRSKRNQRARSSRDELTPSSWTS